MKVFDFMGDLMEFLTVLAFWTFIAFVSVKFWTITLLLLIVGMVLLFVVSTVIV